MDLRNRAHRILEPGDRAGNVGRIVDIIILALISLNILAVVLESVGPIGGRFSLQFFWFEVFSVAIFSIEYLSRIWVSKEDPRYAGFGGRFRYAFTPMALIDLLAILPFYLIHVLGTMTGLDLRFLRVFRLFRMFRIFKVGRYSVALQALQRVFLEKRGELGVTLFVVFILWMVSSSLMYYAERSAQPELFSSIPAAMWWSVATLTTVGYGDIYPITGLGKILAGVIAILGIGLFALPAGILGSGFVEELQRKKKPSGTECTKCGRDMSDQDNSDST